jgi:hypothetical protein
MRGLVLSFRTILRVGTVVTLHDWLARAAATDILPLQRFVRTLQQDLGAVEGAVTEPWSNGPVEGHRGSLTTTGSLIEEALEANIRRKFTDRPLSDVSQACPRNAETRLRAV